MKTKKMREKPPIETTRLTWHQKASGLNNILLEKGALISVETLWDYLQI